jgi:hypothetical protein
MEHTSSYIKIEDFGCSPPNKIVIGTIGPLITTLIGAAIGSLPGGLAGAIGPPLMLAAAAALAAWSSHCCIRTCTQC